MIVDYTDATDWNPGVNMMGIDNCLILYSGVTDWTPTLVELDQVELV
jgi:hypothetical protein